MIKQENLEKLGDSLCKMSISGNDTSLKDNMTLEMVYEMLITFITFNNFYEDMSSKLSGNIYKNKFRNENFPCAVSENLTKFIIYEIYKIMPNWDIKCGDLDMGDKKIEVKCFSTDTPSSFGPTEKWDYIYFLDAMNYKNKYFELYEIKLSNDSPDWRNLTISGIEFDTSNIPELPNNLNSSKVEKLKELCRERGIVQGKKKTKADE